MFLMSINVKILNKVQANEFQWHTKRIIFQDRVSGYTWDARIV